LEAVLSYECHEGDGFPRKVVKQMGLPRNAVKKMGLTKKAVKQMGLRSREGDIDSVLYSMKTTTRSNAIKARLVMD